jgi:RAD3-like DEAD/DEAH box helicase
MSADPTRSAQAAIARLGGAALTREAAQLYSQYTRLRLGAPSLRWGAHIEDARCGEAIQLLLAAEVLGEEAPDAAEAGLKRSAELFEWLSGVSQGQNGLRLSLVSAACYQLGRLPARARSLLSRPYDESGLAQILAFLRSDFDGVLSHIEARQESSSYVESTAGPEGAESHVGGSARLGELLSQEFRSALGVIAANARWGDEARVGVAEAKLTALSRLEMYSAEPDSWLIAHITAQVAGAYRKSDLRATLLPLTPKMSAEGKVVLERYVRAAFLDGRSIAWPSQIKGVDRLARSQSFAFCSPTGSGKTTVAELAILSALFPAGQDAAANPTLVLYLTPTRALGSEVEARLSKVLRGVVGTTVQVTGLYGGTEWGPTDAWLSSDRSTVLICTYEKAEAIVRYLGFLVLARVKLIVVDEAHSVQRHEGDGDLIKGESRALRLEALAARLFEGPGLHGARMIALSAVAHGNEQPLSRWVAGGTSPAEVSDYRSTRQLIGRLDYLGDYSYRIRYDLLDGHSLRFPPDGPSDSPYVPNPIPPCPPIPAGLGSEKRLRLPTLWAAIQLSRPGSDGRYRPVLISVTQQIGAFGRDLLSHLEGLWGRQLPADWFIPPPSGSSRLLWDRCLVTCDDYFGPDSTESRLLRRGLLMHHGALPPPVGRAFVDAAGARIFPVILATSTLSQGVNLPVDSILVPTLRRKTSRVPLQEFLNLAGRAGRPGVATEGQTLVVMSGDAQDLSWQAERSYATLVEEIGSNDTSESGGRQELSALAELIREIRAKWSTFSPDQSDREFANWLEASLPQSPPADADSGAEQSALTGLDTLDGVLIPMVVESERRSVRPLAGPELEEALVSLWSRTYAHAESEEDSLLQRLFVARGMAIRYRHFPESRKRARIYRSGLSPASAGVLEHVFGGLIEHLRGGAEYSKWESEEKLEFIHQTLVQLDAVPAFRWRAKRLDRLQVLRWWMLPAELRPVPEKGDPSDWYDAVNQNLVYRANWGIGSVVALALDELAPESDELPTLENWRKTGLPWAAFWFKELITWGTLDPVISLILSRRLARTREEAAELARRYADSMPDEDANSIIDPWRIRAWLEQEVPPPDRDTQEDFSAIPLTAVVGARVASSRTHRVLPVLDGSGAVRWLDAAGFVMGESRLPPGSALRPSSLYDYVMDSKRGVVTVTPYLQGR